MTAGKSSTGTATVSLPSKSTPRADAESPGGGGASGQRNLAVTANTYTHVLTDETELDYAAVQACSHGAVLGAAPAL